MEKKAFISNEIFQSVPKTLCNMENMEKSKNLNFQRWTARLSSILPQVIISTIKKVLTSKDFNSEHTVIKINFLSKKL